MPAKGQTMLYRPVPDDFAEVFVAVGWSGIERHYCAHARTIARWLEICGRDSLRAARAERVRQTSRKRVGA